MGTQGGYPRVYNGGIPWVYNGGIPWVYNGGYPGCTTGGMYPWVYSREAGIPVCTVGRRVSRVCTTVGMVLPCVYNGGYGPPVYIPGWVGIPVYIPGWVDTRIYTLGTMVAILPPGIWAGYTPWVHLAHILVGAGSLHVTDPSVRGVVRPAWALRRKKPMGESLRRASWSSFL